MKRKWVMPKPLPVLHRSWAGHARWFLPLIMAFAAYIVGGLALASVVNGPSFPGSEFAALGGVTVMIGGPIACIILAIVGAVRVAQSWRRSRGTLLKQSGVKKISPMRLPGYAKIRPKYARTFSRVILFSQSGRFYSWASSPV